MFEAQPVQPESNLTASATQEFNTMQNMFNTMAVSNPSNQVDFFSESTVQPSQPPPQPPQQVTLDLNPPASVLETAPPAPVMAEAGPQVSQSTPSALNFNFPPAGNPSASAFATGMGMQPAASDLNARSFATTTFGNNANSLDLSGNSMFKPT